MWVRRYGCETAESKERKYDKNTSAAVQPAERSNFKAISHTLDLALVVIDASNRDMGTTFHLLNDVIIPISSATGSWWSSTVRTLR